MLPPSIPIKFKNITGFLTSGHPEPLSYFVTIQGLVQGQFNLMRDGWRYYPNDKGYREHGFEPYLIELVTEGMTKNPAIDQ